MSNVIVNVNNLTKKFGKNKVLDDVSFKIREGSIVGLIGPNGAGKTTIMKTLGGLIYPTSGSVELYGASDEKGLNKARSRMSFMIETPYEKGDMNARTNLEKQRIQKGIPDKKRVDEVLDFVGLSDVGKKKVKNFSLGMRQRLGLANAILGKTELMVLDEPINGLDPEGIVEVREMFRTFNKEDKVTLVISSHILSELSQICTDYIFINGGKIRGVFTAEELEAQCSEYYHIDTDDNEKTSVILGDKLGIKKLEVMDDGTIRIYDGLDRIREVSKTLYDNGVIPVLLAKSEMNLEDYYMKMVEKDLG